MARGKGEGVIRTGIGGWSFAPWRETFYPKEVRGKDELAFASRAVGSIEINATFYRSQTEAVFSGWRAAVPEGFLFSVKAARGATMTRDAEKAAASVARFLGSGVTALGPALGPILWQFPATRRFREDELSAFLKLLPGEHEGVALRHAVEMEHESARVPEFEAMLRKAGVASVLVAGEGEMPAFRDTAGFLYARLKGSVDEEERGFSDAALAAWAERLQGAAMGREVFAYVIAGAKRRNPAAARALAEALAAT